MIKDIPMLAGTINEPSTSQRQNLLEILASCHSMTKIQDSNGQDKLIGK